MWRLIIDAGFFEYAQAHFSKINVIYQKRLEAGRLLLHCEAEENALKELVTSLPEEAVFCVEHIKKEDPLIKLPYSGLCIKIGFRRDFSEKELFFDPKGAFGSGFHPSTQLSLALLDYLASKVKLTRVLDFGAGSGILSLVASKLGAQSVIAVDIDFSACLICQENVKLNKLSQVYVVCGTNHALKGIFDLILANIYLRVLLQESENIKQLLNPQGYLICAGFLVGSEKFLKSKYEEFQVIKEVQKEDWIALLLKKQA